MKLVVWPYAMSALVWVGLSAAEISSTAILIGNADNQIALQSGASAPRVLRLTGTGGETWQGSGAEILIDSATVDRIVVPLQWRLDARSSRVHKDSVSLVYQAHHPDLRLYWEWHAPAQHGPIEHTIRIENRSGREVWIPLQDSFRFSWNVAANQPLERAALVVGEGDRMLAHPDRLRCCLTDYEPIWTLY